MAMMNTVPEYILNAVQRLRNYLCGGVSRFGGIVQTLLLITTHRFAEARSSHITHALSLGVLDRLRELIQDPRYGSDIKVGVVATLPRWCPLHSFRSLHSTRSVGFSSTYQRQKQQTCRETWSRMVVSYNLSAHC